MEAGDRAAGDGDEANGKSLPAKTGPVPSMNGVSAGIWSGGSTSRMPSASSRIVPSFRNVER